MLTISGTPQPYFGNPATQDDSGTNYTQRYLVKFDGILTASASDLQLAEAQALTANGIPAAGSTFRANRAAFCKSKSAQVLNQNDKPVGVIVTCVFSTIASEKKDQEEDPLKKRPDITWNKITERVALTACRRIKVMKDGAEQEVKEGAGNVFSLAVTNSFGDAPASFPEVEVAYLQWTVVQNLASFNPRDAENVLYTVNDNQFKIDGVDIAVEQNMIVERSATIKYQGKTSYREVTTSGIIKRTHDVQVLDNGPFAYKGEDGPSAKFKSGINSGTGCKRNGQDAIRRLDGKGNVLGDDQSDVFLEFAGAPKADHNSLNLPSQRL